MLDALVGMEQHPLIRETKRECLEDYWDIAGVEYVLNGIQSGAIRVREVALDGRRPCHCNCADRRKASFCMRRTSPQRRPPPQKTH